MTDHELLIESTKQTIEFFCMGIVAMLLIPFALPFYILKGVKEFVSEITEGM